jgi:ribonucleoside-diphosphate reductase alpha chain
LEKEFPPKGFEEFAMKINPPIHQQGQDPFASVEYEKRTSRISNPDGSVVFEMNDAEIPRQWSQLATDIMVSKYFRKAGVPQVDRDGQSGSRRQWQCGHRSGEIGEAGDSPPRRLLAVLGREAWLLRHAGGRAAFYDELAYMMLHQMCAPNSPQWFNTGLHFAYGITGPAQGHYYCEPRSGEVLKSKDAYSRPAAARVLHSVDQATTW